MRTPLIAGNWKMNTLRGEAIALARGVRERSAGVTGVEKVVCPPYIYLHEVAAAVAGSDVLVGAQTVFWEEKGAYTGEISVTQIAEVARYAIIGHSERRQYFGETDATVNRRVAAALAHAVLPIMCVGETLEQRNAEQVAEVLVRQTRGGLDGVSIGEDLVIAYEPIWAIGTGMAATGEAAQDAAALIRDTLRIVSGDVADAVRILYGGSVTNENAAEFLAQSEIDGALVGGASLKAETFAAIIEAAALEVSTSS